MKYLKGYILILIATLFWGIAATIAKFLFEFEINPLDLVQTRVTFSAVIMTGYFFLFKRRFLVVDFEDIYMFVLLGLIGIAGSNFTYYFTIQNTNVATAILLQYMAPLLVFFYAAISKSESLNFFKLLAGVISIGGCYLVVAGKDFSLITISQLGLLSGIASAFCWAFANVYLRLILKKYPVWTTLVYSFIVASIFWLVINPPWNYIKNNYSGNIWIIFFVFAVISVLIPHTLYFNGLRYITPSRAIITATFEPIVAILSAYFLLQDYLNWIQIIGAVLVISAILILQLRQEENKEKEFETA